MGLYELILCSIYTATISFGLDAISRVKIMKYLAEQGYKLDYEKLTLVTEREKVLGNDKSMSLFIPFYNIVLSAPIFARNLLVPEKEVEYLKMLNVIEKMTPEEITQYQDKPSILNALKINKESEKKYKSRKKEEYKNVYSKKEDLKQVEILSCKTKITNQKTKNYSQLTIVPVQSTIIEEQKNSINEQKVNAIIEDMVNNPTIVNDNVKQLIKK